MFGLRFVEVAHDLTGSGRGGRRVCGRLDVLGEIDPSWISPDGVRFINGRAQFADPMAALYAADSMRGEYLESLAWMQAVADRSLSERVSYSLAFSICRLDERSGKACEPIFVCDCDGVIVLDRLMEYV